MPDQGLIGRPTPVASPHYKTGAYAAAEVRYALRQDGTLGGTVLENGVVLKDCKITVLWRPSMQPIGVTWTDALGVWQVAGLDPTKTQHYAVAIHDKAGGTVYNDGFYAIPTPV
jgi:hypothetical protein